MGTHVNTQYFPVGDPRTPRPNVTPSIFGYQASSRQRAGYERRVVTPTAVEWGGQATPRKLFPATPILGVSETGNQAAYTAAASGCVFLRSPNNNPQQARETLPASHVASARLLTRVINKHPTRSCWGQENYCQSTGGAIGTQFTARPRMRRHRRRLHDRQHGESFHLSSAHARQAPAITRLCL